MNGCHLGPWADLIVIDDPIKATDALSEKERRRVNEAFDNTLYTRLNDKLTGAIVIIMQRLHQDDLVGHVLAKGDWEVVSIPAIETEERAYQLSDDPEHVYIRHAGEVLHGAGEPRDPGADAPLTRVSDLLGPVSAGAGAAGGQHRQTRLAALLRRAACQFDLVIASWDTASTLSESSDYSVGTVWGAKGLDFYLARPSAGPV